MSKFLTFVLCSALLLCGCAVGPDYIKPTVAVSSDYKEAPNGWKMALPQDDCDRGEWWLVFNDAILNELMINVNHANQSIIQAEAQHRQAIALVMQARANLAPQFTGGANVSRDKSPILNNLNQDTNNRADFGNHVTNEYLVTADALWELDLWGSVRRLVEANTAVAQASRAQLALTTLSMQATLAQTYFQLRGIDGDQRVLDNTVNNYQKLYKITHNRYQVGTVSKAAVLQVQSQLEQAQVAAIDNQINRALYEHAIAVLMGMPPANFSLPPCDTTYPVPTIAIEVPSTLLERRPDIAQAERQVAEANAQIGVAIAAYYPVISLTGTYGNNSNHFQQLFSGPATLWSIGSQLAATLFDGGARDANVLGARANFEATVANYRQVVLTAFQEVEDNLATLRILEKELAAQEASVKTAEHALKLVMNEYQAGTVGLADVLNAEITAFTAQKGANDVAYRRFVAAAGLIKALGGGWNTTL